MSERKTPYPLQQQTIKRVDGETAQLERGQAIHFPGWEEVVPEKAESIQRALATLEGLLPSGMEVVVRGGGHGN